MKLEMMGSSLAATLLLVWEREATDPADESQTYRYNTYDLMRIEDGKIQRSTGIRR